MSKTRRGRAARHEGGTWIAMCLTITPFEASRLSAQMLQRRTRKTIALLAVPLAAALVIGAGALRVPAPSDGALELTASLTTRKLTVRKDGEVVKEYDVAVG